MRGGQFHNWMADRVASIFEKNGFTVAMESPVRLPNGLSTVIDVFAQLGPIRIACEIETTPRHATENIERAIDAGLMVWSIVPSREVARRVRAQIMGNQSISTDQYRIFLLGQVSAAIADHVFCSDERITLMEH